MEVVNPPPSPSNSSKCKMYSPHYDHWYTSGPPRTVSYREHEIYPSTYTNTAAPRRRQSQSQGKRASKERRSKSRTPRAEEIQTKNPEPKKSPQPYLVARTLPDGTREWAYVYPPENDTAPPKNGKSKRDIYDPSVFLATPNLAAVSDYLQDDVVPPTVDEQVPSSDGGGTGGDYGSQMEYPDVPDITTTIHPITDWGNEEPPAIPVYISPPSNGDYDQRYHAKSKAKQITTKNKRRESFTATPQKPGRWERFFFPEMTREAVKQGKVRNDRVDMWLSNVPLDFAEDIAQQTQQYSINGRYQSYS